MRHRIRFCGAVLLALSIQWTAGAQARVEDSVVKIMNQYNRFSWYAPWESGATGSGMGSGFVISGKRILTNAHVVSDSAMLLVYFYNDPTPYPARVAAIGHDCDLAILELADPSRIAEVPELEFDALPPLRSRVVTYGYPAGGKLLSSTAGVVSRIEVKDYVHSGMDSHLTVQTDAAINPGNSGGPVIQDGKVVGVAFQGNQQLENMGFFIPVQVVDHFLTDLKDGKYDGYPELGLFAATLDSPAARRYAGMKEGETGIRVEHLIRGCGAETVLQKDDIITSIGGYPVANDGTVEWNGMRLDFGIVADQLQKGETLPVELIRAKGRMMVEIELNHYNPLEAKSNLYDIKPTYFVYAGLVFAPLNRETIKTYSEKWVQEAPQELVNEMYFRYLEDNDFADAPQVMVIRRLDHEVNVEEMLYTYRLLDTVNGKTVRTVADVVEAIEGNTADQHLIRLQHGNRLMVLNREEADAVNTEILEKYAIPKDRNL
ncbi:S1C family serine protease [Pontiella sulfatireligans]|uniref:Serine protease Do-like HtrA n=1 Tax=Pontiella sulfatireligans TaxID=2750658 RepID=A0A6C2UNF1_9BACT|nr:S1C family serine protease [Pontiella sulfatireligans]VGO21792.1 Serine protease Do-like HtrA [Pontiella sulfatireligans]